MPNLNEEFAKFIAPRRSAKVFFGGRVALSSFDGFEGVVMPDGRVLDADPMPPMKIDRIHSGILLLEAFA